MLRYSYSLWLNKAQPSLYRYFVRVSLRLSLGHYVNSSSNINYAYGLYLHWPIQVKKIYQGNTFTSKIRQYRSIHLYNCNQPSPCVSEPHSAQVVGSLIFCTEELIAFPSGSAVDLQDYILKCDPENVTPRERIKCCSITEAIRRR